MYTKTELKSAFFFKLGTHRRVATFEELSKELQTIWVEKFHHKYKDNTLSFLSTSETYEKHADFIPEFAEITSISCGTVDDGNVKTDPLVAEVDTITGTEKVIFDQFCKVMEKASTKGYIVAGYNILNYQIPFLVKRLLINKVKLPLMVNLRNKKPWDITAIDIMRDYQGNMFGDIDVNLVALQFGVPVAKDVTEELRTAMGIAIAMCQK